MDYVFYRIYQYYKSKENIPIYRGILFVFVCQLCTVLFAGVTINLLFGNILSNNYIEKRQYWMLYGGILIVLYLTGIFRYGRKQKVKNIVKRYEGNRLNTRMKIWQIFMIPIILILLTILMVIIVSAFG